MQLYRAMGPRDPDEHHRAATTLELFYDLTFVVAVAQAAAALHHGLVDGHAADVVGAFPLVFFGIWWAWMNFTWFASAYDTDDAVYRVAVFVQMAGVLVLAAGIPRAVDAQDWGVVVLGYVIMRLALVGQWLRAAHQHADGRACTRRYAFGIAACQTGWVAWLALPEGAQTAAFIALAALELAVPVWAERQGRTSWHAGHIAERYGLFTIIVLGESILAATIGVQTALDGDVPFADLAPVVVGGLLIVFSLWWTYFDLGAEQVVARARNAFAEHVSAPFVWGYGHYVIFGSAAAVGAGLSVGVDQATHHSVLTDLEAGLAVTVPVCLFLVAIWVLHLSQKPPGFMKTTAVPVAVVVIIALSWSPEPVLFTGIAVAVLVALHVVAVQRHPPAPGLA